jgi:hypothetical protein
VATEEQHLSQIKIQESLARVEILRTEVAAFAREMPED